MTTPTPIEDDTRAQDLVTKLIAHAKQDKADWASLDPVSSSLRRFEANYPQATLRLEGSSEGNYVLTVYDSKGQVSESYTGNLVRQLWDALKLLNSKEDTTSPIDHLFDQLSAKDSEPKPMAPEPPKPLPGPLPGQLPGTPLTLPNK